ncbi:MAG: rhomboid family intramembrane serine protease [Deltaproteobacteria bacterium]|nr:rhomboid family intramembrane serine protease [Deltaproteobacteria bacterium]
MQNNKRNSLLCPRCRKLISADEPVCPYCGLNRPGSRTIIGLVNRFQVTHFDAVRIIIYINAALYVLSLIFGSPMRESFMNPLTFLSPSNEGLFLLGGTGTIPFAGYGRWWTLVSASFLHGGILHIFFNMAALAQVGPFVLNEFGFSRFTLVYIVSGAAGFFLSVIAGVPFTIGASAGICGLIGAILYYGKTRGGLYGDVIYRQALGWIVGLAIFGFFVPEINNWAHGGGLAAGIILAVILGYHEQRNENTVHRVLGAVCVLLTVAILLWAITQALAIHFFSSRFP